MKKRQAIKVDRKLMCNLRNDDVCWPIYRTATVNRAYARIQKSRTKNTKTVRKILDGAQITLFYSNGTSHQFKVLSVMCQSHSLAGTEKPRLTNTY